MKMKWASMVFLSLIIPAIFALEVDRSELSTGTGDAITFINYTGPNAVISSAAEIRGIGTALGTSLNAANGTPSASGDAERYYVIHAVDSTVKTGFDADILVLGPQAGVDHIDNLRRILGAYLSAAYGYSDKDSTTLANFITVYNAVYRGKIDVFSARYKKVVTGNLSGDKVGLSLRYNEWPGKTQIVIPLSDPRLAGTISSIDTTTLTDKAVVEKIKEDGTAGTDARKDMAALKEREGDAAQNRAETAQADATAARAEVTQKQTELVAATKDAAQAQASADQAARIAQDRPTDQAAQAEASAAQAKADEKQATVEEKKAELAASEEKVATKEQAAEADQKLADTKQKETQTERKDIASDTQKELDAKDAERRAIAESALATAQSASALRIVDGASLLGEIALVNLGDGSVVKTSSLNTVRGRTLIDTGSGLLAIAGKKGGSSSVRLVLIDPSTLEIVKQGMDAIAESSALSRNENDFYAVIELEGGKFVLGRFDKNLDAKAKSTIEVAPYTAITVTDKGILAQDKGGSLRLLRASDLADQTK